MFDILIRGGSVADGTGRPAFAADVAVSGGRIAAVGDLRGADAAQVWNASGKTVTPGGAVELCHILGKDEVLRRIKLGMAKLEG